MFKKQQIYWQEMKNNEEKILRPEQIIEFKVKKDTAEEICTEETV